MQRRRGVGYHFFDFGHPFPDFGDFGSFGPSTSLLSNFFGGRDLFDDPFFTHPFGGMLESSLFGPRGFSFPDVRPSGFLDDYTPGPRKSRGPIIEELNSDDEKEDAKDQKENPRKRGRSISGPYMEDPGDEVEERKSKRLQYENGFNRFNEIESQPQAHSFCFQSSTVSYGGRNGTYYTSSRTRRTGSDGVTFEESKEADSATGQASHRVSRGLYNKGHSFTRKLNSDGMVDTMQTLHNLNEGELADFEGAWKRNAQKYLPGWIGSIGGSSSGQAERDRQGGWALPSTHGIGTTPEAGDKVGSSSSSCTQERSGTNTDNRNEHEHPRRRGRN